MIRLNKNPEIVTHYLKDDSVFPNNLLPLVLLKAAFQLSGYFNGLGIRKILKNNLWEKSWSNGIYKYHHYHSTAHEVLVAYRGKSWLRLGGEKGVVFVFNKGDVLIIPAGVAHKSLYSSSEFKCIGAYPKGQDYDMNYGDEDERPQTDKNIKNVPLPKADPVFGANGPLMKHWKIK